MAAPMIPREVMGMVLAVDSQANVGNEEIEPNLALTDARAGAPHARPITWARQTRLPPSRGPSRLAHSRA